MLDKFFSTKLYISLFSLEQNLDFLKNKLSHETEIIAVLKANAYGFGDVELAKILIKEGIKHIAVADFEEGMRLKRHGINIPIIIMYPGLNNLKSIVENDLEPTIYSVSMLDRLIVESKKMKKNVFFHLKIDTGMKRYGLEKHEIKNVIDIIKNSKNIKVKSIFSHFASSKNKEEDLFTKSQIDTFQNHKEYIQKTLQYKIKFHISNSHGILNYVNSAFDMIRVGFALYYGLCNKETHCIAELKSSISQIKKIKKGDSIGYNRSFIAKNEMKIAIIPMGYADGLKRSWGNGKLSFFMNNCFLPVIGEISMDSCVIDITKLQHIKEGDEVILFGAARTIFELSKQLDTIPYEITAALSKRIRRVYK